MPLKGINAHQYPYATTTEVNYLWLNAPRLIDSIWAAGIRMVRVNAELDIGDATVPSQITRMTQFIGLCKDRGIKVQIAFISPYKYSPASYPTALSRTTLGATNLGALLNALPIKPDYIELENEITLTLALPYDQGQTQAEFNTAPYLAYADLLRGELEAARTYAPNSKVIVGTIMGHYAFIPWLVAQGVTMDIAGYHAYLRTTEDPANWFGLGQDLAAVFQSWGLPVSVNEVNGNPAIEAQPIVGQQGLRAVDYFLGLPTVESVLAYEWFDSIVEPGFGVATFGANAISVNANSAAMVAALAR